MFLFIHTITVVSNDFELSTRFYHALKTNIEQRRLKMCLLGKSVAVSIRKRNDKRYKGKHFFKRNVHPRFNARHAFEAIKIDSSSAVNNNSLRPHGNPSPKVNSPGKPENNAAANERSIEKVRSPVPAITECSSNPPLTQLTPESNTQQTAQWLRKNSFGNYISTFANFNGADILRLTRDDLIQICGLADGIRLLYALHSKAIVRLTLYFCTPGSGVYHAVYLDQVGRNEISRKLAALLGVHQNQIHDIYMQGPNGIRVLITDEVVNNIKDESMFSIEVLKDENRERFLLLLKPAKGAT